MATFTVNGQTVSVADDVRLLPYFREVLGLVSLKDGCSEGACGACMAIVDGKAVRLCVQKAKAMEGKTILTIEGFSAREREVYAYAFAKVGAVQCGFCIPGMIVSGKALIDRIPDPTPQQVKEAIKFNICRCTGYQKIEEGILLAAKLLRENTSLPHDLPGMALGSSFLRVDAIKKACQR